VIRKKEGATYKLTQTKPNFDKVYLGMGAETLPEDAGQKGRIKRDPGRLLKIKSKKEKTSLILICPTRRNQSTKTQETKNAHPEPRGKGGVPAEDKKKPAAEHL